MWIIALCQKTKLNNLVQGEASLHLSWTSKTSKLVIFHYSLSHFCDLFWNVTMIINICFIWQFCGHSNNYAQVLPKTNSLGTPQGPQKVSKNLKTYLKLLMTLADSCWFWLTLTNSGWLLMTLADSGCPPESFRVSQSQPESVRVGKSHLNGRATSCCFT